MSRRTPILLLTMLSVGVAVGQWEPMRRLSDYPCMVRTCGRSLAVSSGILHFVWWTSGRAFCSRSTDHGGTWEVESYVFSVEGRYHYYPVISAEGSRVCLAVRQDTPRQDYIGFVQSTDNGASWGRDTAFPVSDYCHGPGGLACSGDFILLFWAEDNRVSSEVTYCRSTDGGVSWSAAAKLPEDSASSYDEVAAMSGDTVHVAWFDERLGGRTVFYRRSIDAGRTWQPERHFTSSAGLHDGPTISVSSGAVHLAWADYQAGHRDLRYVRSLDGGGTWEDVMSVHSDTFGLDYPCIASSDTMVHLVWGDWEFGAKAELYYAASSSKGEQWSTPQRLTSTPFHTTWPNLGVTGPNLHLVWGGEIEQSRPYAHYMRNPTGNIGIGETPRSPALGRTTDNSFVREVLPLCGRQDAALLDITGRRVMSLQPGQNDIRHLAPGVYFVRREDSNSTAKIIIQR